MTVKLACLSITAKLTRGKFFSRFNAFFNQGQSLEAEVEKQETIKQLNESACRLRQVIEEQKAAQQALRASEQQLNLILRNIPQSVWVLDSVGNIRWINPHAYELHQLYVGGDELSKLTDYISLFECKRADGYALTSEEWPASQALSGKLVRNVVLYVTRRDTGKKWIGLYAAVPICDSAGRVLQVIVTIDDITERKKHEGKLLLLGEITENSAEGVILVKAADSLVQYTNQKFNVMFGYAPGELEGKPVSMLVAQADNTSSEIIGAIIRSLEEQSTWSGELLSLRKDGTVFWTSATVSTFIHPEHGLLWIGYQTDITSRIQAEEKLLLAARVFDSSTEAIMVTDASRRIISVNPAFTEITGYNFVEVEGKSPHILSSGLHDSAFYDCIRQSLVHHSRWQGEIWNRRKNGEIYPEWLNITQIKNSNGEVSHYVGFFSDISENKATQQKIEFLIYNDALTGLPNRLFAMESVNQAIASAQQLHTKFAVLVIGMDNFKSINDSLGHPVGDRILAEVALRLRESLQDTDLVSRLVGDKFLVLLKEGCEGDNIFHVSERILVKIALPFKIGNQEISTSVSIGIAVFPHDGNDFDALLKNADSAMNLAKESGHNAYRFFDESTNTNAFEYLHLRNGLRRALEKGDLALYYQPEFDLCSGKLVGAEALLRWYDPELGLVQPNHFVAVAEKSGLIVPIGEWVLQEACQQAKEWQLAGLPKFVMGVNLSAVQFKRGDLAGTVKKALDKSGLKPGYLELELTESILIRDTEITLATVRHLKVLGVKLSIDDFGTGYSSLSYLKRFNVDRIKIDQSFVRDVNTDLGDVAIVQAIIQIAKSLSLKTIAEGVENQDTAEKLKALGCNDGQGYFFAHPMPKEEFAVYLAHYNLSAIKSK